MPRVHNNHWSFLPAGSNNFKLYVEIQITLIENIFPAIGRGKENSVLAAIKVGILNWINPGCYQRETSLSSLKKHYLVPNEYPKACIYTEGIFVQNKSNSFRVIMEIFLACFKWFRERGPLYCEFSKCMLMRVLWLCLILRRNFCSDSESNCDITRMEVKTLKPIAWNCLGATIPYLVAGKCFIFFFLISRNFMYKKVGIAQVHRNYTRELSQRNVLNLPKWF